MLGILFLLYTNDLVLWAHARRHHLADVILQFIRTNAHSANESNPIYSLEPFGLISRLFCTRQTLAGKLRLAPSLRSCIGEPAKRVRLWIHWSGIPPIYPSQWNHKSREKRLPRTTERPVRKCRDEPRSNSVVRKR